MVTESDGCQSHSTMFVAGATVGGGCACPVSVDDVQTSLPPVPP